MICPVKYIQLPMWPHSGQGDAGKSPWGRLPFFNNKAFIQGGTLPWWVHPAQPSFSWPPRGRIVSAFGPWALGLLPPTSFPPTVTQQMLLTPWGSAQSQVTSCGDFPEPSLPPRRNDHSSLFCALALCAVYNSRRASGTCRVALKCSALRALFDS